MSFTGLPWCRRASKLKNKPSTQSLLLPLDVQEIINQTRTEHDTQMQPRMSSSAYLWEESTSTFSEGSGHRPAPVTAAPWTSGSGSSSSSSGYPQKTGPINIPSRIQGGIMRPYSCLKSYGQLTVAGEKGGHIQPLVPKPLLSCPCSRK